MPNIAALLKTEITRLARKEIRAEVESLRKMSTAHRSEIAVLKKQVKSLQAELRRVARGSTPGVKRTDEVGPDVQLRFRAAGMKTHRQKLGLSAKDYGLLVGASALSIYKWEDGKVQPRGSALVKIAAARKLGKREALRRLEDLRRG
jgi:DNA-binding transcriptional regulator YiaG